MPSQKIDHAGLRAERRNGGLALLGSDSDRLLLVINLSLHTNSHHVVATLLSGLGDDGRRSR